MSVCHPLSLSPPLSFLPLQIVKFSQLQKNKCVQEEVSGGDQAGGQIHCLDLKKYIHIKVERMDK